ncbi:MAG: glycosyltransferase family 2 protein [Acidobacteriota bacterium]|nr:glycosyltransferase family 2 protein [Acidobacteriota bacterium]
MPTAGRHEFIRGAVACFLAQDYPDTELVILDDGAQPVEALLPADSRIRYYRELPKQTTGNKRNRCCELSSGDVIVHFDDDDWSAPGRIRHQLETLMADASKRVTGFNLLLFWDVRSECGYRYRLHDRYALGTSQMYFRSWWEQNRFSSRQLGEDSDFAFRAKRAGVIVVEDGAQWLVARIHDGRTSTTEPNTTQFLPEGRASFPEEFFACASTSSPTSPTA